MLRLKVLSSCLLIMLLCLSSCQRSIDRNAQRAQALLDEADLLIDSRLFTDAELKTKEANEKLTKVIEKYPDNIDYRLLHIRSLMTLFVARNTLTIEQADIRPRSLVRFPDTETLSDFSTTIIPAELALKEIIHGSAPLKFDQKAYVHSTLAAIYRLKVETNEESLKEYNIALSTYEEELQRLRSEEKALGSNKFAIMRIEHNIRSLQQAKTEVLLLVERWDEALEVLRDSMAGTDLKFFPVQFDLLEGEIAILKNKLSLDETLAEGSRESKLLQSIEAKKKERWHSKQENLGGKNPYQVELLLRQVQLDELQNNLMYRIIALYQLKESERLEQARKTLRGHYPEMDAELYQLLQEYP